MIMDKKRILIVDDHPMMREALQTAITEEDDLEVVSEASNGEEALAQIDINLPDVILMDLLMPGMGGLETITRIIDKHPQARILVLTSMEDENNIIAAIQAGALGYFPKTAPRAFLLEAIRKVADGIPYLPSGIAQKLFAGLRAGKSHSPTTLYREPITIRQKEILTLLGEGRSDAEIASSLHLEEATVRSHIHNILQRLGLETRFQAVAYVNHPQRPE
jgi:two-component system response regulator DevR